MKNYNLLTKSKYWLIKHYLKSIQHYFNVKFFKFDNFLGEETDKVHLVKKTISGITSNIIRAFTFILILFFIEYIFNDSYDTFLPFLNPNLVSFIEIIPKPNYPKSTDSVLELITLIASVSGVLLALFYPILATIASSAYSKVNSNIRNLLFIEPQTQKYMRDLAFITTYSIWTLLFIIFDFYPGNLILFTLVILCLYGLFHLLKIGSGVYELFDPKKLMQIVVLQITKDLEKSIIPSPYWNNESFQDYFRLKTEKNLENVRLINELSFEGIAVNRNAITSTIGKTFYLINFYLNSKNKIPRSSNWFRKHRQHSSFFELGTGIRELTFNTEKFPVPKDVPDTYWFENEIIDLYKNLGYKVCSYDKSRVTIEYVYQSSNTLAYLGSLLEFDSGLYLLRANRDLVLRSLFFDKKSYQENKDNLGLIEMYLNVSVQYFMSGIINRIEQIKSDWFLKELDKVDWSNSRSLYDLNIPSFLLPILEGYYKKINNEKYLEGRVITPLLFINQNLSADYVFHTSKGLEKTFNQLFEDILYFVTYCDTENPLIATYSSLTAYDILSKVENNFLRLRTNLEEMKENTYIKGAFVFRDFDSDLLLTTLKYIKQESIKICNKHLVKVSRLEWESTNPDIFSLSYMIISKELCLAIKENNKEKYELFLPSFVSAIKQGYPILKSRYKGVYKNDNALIYQLHIELMQIFGFIYIFSDLHKNFFWDYALAVFYELEFNNRELNDFFVDYLTVESEYFGFSINSAENNYRISLIDDYKKKNQIYSSHNRIVNYYLKNGISDDLEHIFIEFIIGTRIAFGETMIRFGQVGKRVLLDLFKN